MIHLGRPSIRYAGGTSNVVFDGNSLTAGDGSTNGANVAVQTAALPPLSGAVPVVNVGVSGQTTRSMNGLDGGSTSDVEAAFDASKAFNVLFAWEITNSVQSAGRTGAQAVSDMVDYCHARKTTHPGWKIILVGTLPRYQAGSFDIGYVNDQLLLADKLMAQNYRSMGADAFVNLRVAGGPFDLPDWTLASFDRAITHGLWSAGDDPAIRVHLNNSGYAFVANQEASALRRLKA